ncbi:hypothetical protein COHA_010100 [Chlorella ohadii]|uniref:L-ascorbate peroxidase n=1 Tax=Chlorella ohadii TaxID=2649997 RepID=A0AAD5GXA0_9CHLO|nr:hypothetical protein COHA_010100 [Chlorella ohadii]
MRQAACKPARCGAAPNLARRQQAPVAHCSSTGAQPPVQQPAAAPSRRQLLRLAAGLPALALLPALAAPLPAAAAAPGPRFLTPEEQAAVDAAFAATCPKAKAPVIVRLVFHDAGSYSAAAGDGGVNASIQYELDRPDNFGLKRGWNVIEATAKKLQGTAAEGLSRADLIALAGAHAVRITGGPQIKVAVGRRDATAADPDGRMPALDSSAEQLLANFADKGLSARELIVLSGSHTLGSKGYGDPVTFDNTYYKTLLDKPWERVSADMAAHIGIPTDHVLPDNPTCRPFIEEYAADQQLFFRDFAAAFAKMTELGARWA